MEDLIKIYLSPSSQPENKYAAGNTNEQEQCRKIAVKCAEALKRCGRFDPLVGLANSMYSRVEESNAWGAKAHIPIHTNAHNKKVAGFRGFCYSVSGEGFKLLSAIEDAVAPITPGTSDGLSARPDLYEVKASDAPCAYLELGFHDNPEEAQYIIDHTEELAEAICKGVCKHHSVKYVAPAEKPAATENIYRVFNAAGKQVGAYSVEANAFNMAKEQLKLTGAAKITYGPK
jgi:N-acetylmuramoyl-L-alanine amidase